MNDQVRWLLGLAASLLLLVTGIPQPAGADGGVFPAPRFDVEMPAQKAILVYNEKSGHEDLILSVKLQSGSEAAWVVPMPSLPEVKAASPKWFEQLSDLTQPKIENLWRTDPSGQKCVEAIAEAPAGVDLLSREQVGIYDVSILSADKQGALLDWLNTNGYAFPEEGGPLLDTYVEEGGWYFVAVRVLPGERAGLEGDVHPLWFSFDVERPIYPMRLTALMKDNLDVLIYVLSDHRMVILGQAFETEFTGELFLQIRGEVGTEVGAEEVELLTQRPYYVTKLRERLDASAIAQDLYFDHAASDEPYRKVIYITTWVCSGATQPAPGQVTSERPSAGIYVGLAALGLLAGLGLVWWWPRRKSDEK
jgi:hypothetical protein